MIFLLAYYIHATCTYILFSFIRTSNFGAKAERSDIFLRSEVEHNVLNMFLNLHGIPQKLYHLMTLMMWKLFWNRCKYETADYYKVTDMCAIQ